MFTARHHPIFQSLHLRLRKEYSSDFQPSLETRYTDTSIATKNPRKTTISTLRVCKIINTELDQGAYAFAYAKFTITGEKAASNVEYVQFCNRNAIRHLELKLPRSWNYSSHSQKPKGTFRQILPNLINQLPRLDHFTNLNSYGLIDEVGIARLVKDIRARGQKHRFLPHQWVHHTLTVRLQIVWDYKTSAIDPTAGSITPSSNSTAMVTVDRKEKVSPRVYTGRADLFTFDFVNPRGSQPAACATM